MITPESSGRIFDFKKKSKSHKKVAKRLDFSPTRIRGQISSRERVRKVYPDEEVINIANNNLSNNMMLAFDRNEIKMNELQLNDSSFESYKTFLERFIDYKRHMGTQPMCTFISMRALAGLNFAMKQKGVVVGVDISTVKDDKKLQEYFATYFERINMSIIDPATHERNLRMFKVVYNDPLQNIHNYNDQWAEYIKIHPNIELKTKTLKQLYLDGLPDDFVKIFKRDIQPTDFGEAFSNSVSKFSEHLAFLEKCKFLGIESKNNLKESESKIMEATADRYRRIEVPLSLSDGGFAASAQMALPQTQQSQRIDFNSWHCLNETCKKKNSRVFAFCTYCGHNNTSQQYVKNNIKKANMVRNSKQQVSYDNQSNSERDANQATSEPQGYEAQSDF